MYALVRRVLIDPNLSEEVTQEIFLMVWRDAKEYRAEAESPAAWLMMISRRRAVDRVRSEQSNTEPAPRWTAARPREDDSVTETVIDRDEAGIFVDGQETLTNLQRRAIDLAFHGGMTYAEVAQHLDTPRGTVKTGISDGLKKLRLSLDDA